MKQTALLAAALSLLAGVAPAQPLAEYAWEARPIVLFAPSSADPALLDQLALFEGAEAARADREAPLILVIAEQAVFVDNAPSNLDAAEIRQFYGAPAERFSVLLIGKDTGVKLRSAAPVPPRAFFALIDQMPMRRREMRTRSTAE